MSCDSSDFGNASANNRTDEKKTSYQFNIPLSLQTTLNELQEQILPSYVLHKDCVNAINQLLKNICQKIVMCLNLKGKKQMTVHDIQSAIQTFFPSQFAEDVIDTKNKSSDDHVLSVNQVNHFLQCTNYQLEADCSLYLTTVLEFLANEIMEGAAEAADCDDNREISLFHLRRSIWGDEPNQYVKSKSSSKSSSISHFTGDSKLQEIAYRVGWTWLKDMPYQ